MMTYQGTVRGGVVVLDPGTHLPEGATVTVQPQIVGSDATTSPFYLRNGVPVFPERKDAQPVTVELVNQLRDEQP